MQIKIKKVLTTSSLFFGIPYKLWFIN